MPESQPESAIDKHLTDIKLGSDLARAMQLVTLGVAVLFLGLAAANVAVDGFTALSWGAALNNALTFAAIATVLRFVRSLSLTMVNVVDELRTTV